MLEHRLMPNLHGLMGADQIIAYARCERHSDHGCSSRNEPIHNHRDTLASSSNHDSSQPGNFEPTDFMQDIHRIFFIWLVHSQCLLDHPDLAFQPLIINACAASNHLCCRET